MQPQEAHEPRPVDLPAAVVLKMRQCGVAPFPRNYEIFYEAATGANKDLSRALEALGARPTQQELDKLACRLLGSDAQSVVENARDTISSKLDEILSLLKKENGAMETYGKILGETSTGLSNRSAISKDFLEKIVGVMATATRTSIEKRNQLVTSMKDKSSELQEVKSKLEEYKRLADTDALTQLHNRRAFDKEIARIYDSSRGVTFGALVLADIDRFKTVNDCYGHPVGDRIIQIVAGVIKAAAGERTFVARTGGEEFALILEGMGEESTERLAEQIRVTVAETPFVNVASGTNYGPITISLGTCMATQAQGPDELYMKADRALYASKSAGRNRVTRYSALSEGRFTKGWMLYRRD